MDFKDAIKFKLFTWTIASLILDIIIVSIIAYSYPETNQPGNNTLRFVFMLCILFTLAVVIVSGNLDIKKFRKNQNEL